MSHKEVITTRLSQDTVSAVDRLAGERGWSRSQWIGKAVERAVAGELAKEPLQVASRPKK